MVAGRRTGSALVALALLGTTAGCGGDRDAGSASASSTTSISSSSAAPSTEEETTAPATTSSSRPTATSSAPPTTGAGSTTSGSPLSTEDAGRQLTLADFFQPDSSWEEQRYDIAGQQDVQGIGIELPYCTSNPFELELRLQNNFDQLEFSVAQADDSAISDQEVVVEVVANNAQVDIRTVPFNLIQPISVPVTGVNALKLQFSQNDELDNCSGAVTAVLTGVTVR